MSPRNDDAVRLSADDEAFVRRIAEASAPPEMSSVQRARFDARLAARLSRRSRPRGLRLLVPAAAVAAALAVLFLRPSDSTRESVGRATRTATGVRAGEAMLAMATEPVVDADAALPDDYRAISELVLGQ